MDTDYLRDFLLVVECGSIAEAARRLDLTPAAVGARIRALEASLGSPLLRRTGRTVRPTESGLRIVEHARGLLRGVDDLRALARYDVPVRELRLGVSSSALAGVIPPLLRGLYDAFPGLEVYIEPGNSAGLYQRLTGDFLDAVLIVEPQFELSKAYAWQVLVEEPLCVLAPHRLHGDDPLALLRNAPFIRYDRNMWGGRLADKWLRDQGIEPHERIEIDSLQAIAAFVDQGLGVALVPDWTPPWPQGLTIRKLPLPATAPARRLGLAWFRGPKAVLAEHMILEARRLWTDLPARLQRAL
jgi:DNA-binding transcriptional LysR family regulator